MNLQSILRWAQADFDGFSDEPSLIPASFSSDERLQAKFAWAEMIIAARSNVVRLAADLPEASFGPCSSRRTTVRRPVQAIGHCWKPHCWTAT